MDLVPLAPSVELSSKNAERIGIELGTSYTEVLRIVSSQGWTEKQRCLAFSSDEPCVAKLQRGSRLAWLFLNCRDERAVVFAVSLGNCFDCKAP